MPAVFGILRDAERVIEERLHHRAQEQFFVRALLQALDADEIKVGAAHSNRIVD